MVLGFTVAARAVRFAIQCLELGALVMGTSETGTGTPDGGPQTATMTLVSPSLGNPLLEAANVQ